MAAKRIDSNEIDLNSPSDVTFDGVYTPDVPEIIVVPAGRADSKGNTGVSAYAQELAFNEEYVEIMVSESTDQNAEEVVFTSCNGTPQYFVRGQVQRVKRKYVAILASCKEHSLSTPEYTGRDGARATKISRTSSLKYPFMVVSDPNPRGAAWLKGLIQSQT